MSIVVDIEVDPTKASVGIQRVGGDLTGLGQQAAKTGVVLQGAFDTAPQVRALQATLDTLAASLTRASDTAVRMKAGGDQLAASFGSLGRAITASGLKPAADGFAAVSAQLEREGKILEQIRQPMRDYQLDVLALTKLQDKGLITAAQYAAELQRVRTASGASITTLGSAASSSAGGTSQAFQGGMKSLIEAEGGKAGQIFNAMAEGGEAAMGAIAGVAHALIDYGDALTTLENKSQKFTTSTHSTNQVIADQLDLGGELHASLDETMNFYDAIRDGTDDLNTTYDENLRLTKEIGEAVELSGHKLSEAGGVMETLSYAFANGTISGRELKGLMKTMPDLATILTSELGHSRAELVKLANEGKVTGDQLQQAFNDAGAAIQDKFDKQVETATSKWQRFKDGAGIVAGKIGQGFEMAANGNQDDLSAKVEKDRHEVEKLVALRDREAATIEKSVVSQQQLNDSIASLTARRATATDEQKKAIDQQIGAERVGLEQVAAISDRAVAGRKQNLDALQNQPELLAKATKEIGEQETLSASIATNLIGAATKLGDAFDKVGTAQRQLGVDFQKDLDGAVTKARALAEEYKRVELLRVQGFGPDHFKDSTTGNQQNANPDALFEAAQKAQNAVRDMTNAPQLSKAFAISDTVGDATRAISYLSDAIKNHTVDARAGAAAIKSYREEIRNAYGDAGTDYVKQQLEAIRGPWKNYSGAVDATNYLLKIHAVSASQAADQISKLGLAYAKAAEDTKIFDQAAVSFDKLLADDAAHAKKQIDDLTKSLDYLHKNGFGSSATDKGETSWLGANGKDIDKVLTDLHGAAATYGHDVDVLDALYARGTITAEEYRKELEKISTAFAQQAGIVTRSSEWAEFSSGAVAAGKQIETSLLHTADAVRDAFVGTFQDLNAQLVDVLTGQKANWGAFLNSLEKRWASLALQQAEGGILRAFGAGTDLGTAPLSAAAAAKAAAANGALETSSATAAGSVGGLGGSSTIAATAIDGLATSVGLAVSSLEAFTASAATSAAAPSSSAATSAAAAGVIATGHYASGVTPGGGGGAPAFRPGLSPTPAAVAGVAGAGASSSSERQGFPATRVVNQFPDARKSALEAVNSPQATRTLLNRAEIDRRRREGHG